MVAKIATWLLVSKLVLAQLNGEFWWLNNKVSEYHHTIIPQPKFENLSEFDNDESDRIVFRDITLFAIVKNHSKPIDKVDRMKVYDHFQDENKIIWPTNDINKNDVTISNYLLKDDIKIEQEKKYQPYKNNEEFTFSGSEKSNFTNSIDIYLPINPVNITTLSTNTKDAVVPYEEIKNNKPQSNKFKLNNVQEHFQVKNSIVWPSDIKKVKDVFKSKFPKEIAGVELKTDNPLPHNENSELPFIFPETQTDKFHFKDVSNSNTEVTTKKKYKVDILNAIKNNKNRDNIDVYNVGNDYPDENKIVWPRDDNKTNKSIIDNNFPKDQNTKQLNKNDTMPQKIKDEFTFIFPEIKQDKYILEDMPTSSTEKTFTLPEKATVVTKNNLESIIFFDDIKPSEQKYNNIITNNKSQDNFPGKNQIVWPSHIKKNNIKSNFLKDDNTMPQKNEDTFLYSTPKQDMPTSTNKTLSELDNNTAVPEFTSEDVSLINNKLTTTIPKKETQTKTICTYMEKHECNLRNGFIYSYEFGKSQKHVSSDPQLICCVLPLPMGKKVGTRKNGQGPVDINRENLQIYFSNTPQQRNKRSNNEAANVNAALKQRNVLLKRKYGIQSQIANPGLTQTKIVTPDSNEDPYWNIKNPQIESSNKQNKQEKYGYFDDYAHDYVDELPKPGLVGLYSDHGPKLSPWAFINQEAYGGSSDYDDVDDTDTSSFGYSTIDPRAGLNSKTRKRGKPLKLTTNSEEDDAERQIINFQSTPDFHVLEGFKLLNLVRNQKRVHTHNGRKTTESSDEDGSKGSLVTRPFEISSENGDDKLIEKDQLFKGCGRSVKVTRNNDRGSRIGDAEVGTHPWLALVVQTENVHNILCYAALLHPRSAITAAECVYGSFPGEVTIITGLWDLNQRARSSSRVPSVHFHPKFSHGGLAHGLSILNWKRPLRLDVHVQPVCLAEAQSGDDCKFFGWGGFDQEIRPRSRWQRATVSSCSRLVSANKHVDLPRNAFCAIMSSRDTVVTGVGGPLVCNVDGRQTVVGVAVYRQNDVIVLLPARDMALAAGDLIDDD